MNDRIKNAGIVLTTGVLLGWTSSAALATNFVGVDAGSFNAYVHNGDGTVSVVPFTDALTIARGTEGELRDIQVTAGGEGYDIDANGNVLAITDPAAALPVTTAGNGTYATDGLAASYNGDPALGGAFSGANVSVSYGGTGYADANNGGAGFILVTMDSTCAGVDPGWTAGAAGATTGVELAANTVWATAGAASAAHNIANITIVGGGGVGYGDATDEEMIVAIDGVVTTDYAVTYSTNADGTIGSLDVTVNGTETGFLAGSQMTLTPQSEIAGVANNGFGWDYSIELYGEILGFNTLAEAGGRDCTVAGTTITLAEDTGSTIVAGGVAGEATFTIGDLYTGTAISAALGGTGSGYTVAPEFAVDTAGAGTGATFTSALQTSFNLVTLADGTSPSLSDNWLFTTGGDFNGDGTQDLLINNRGTGEVAVWNNLGGGVWEAVEVGNAGSAWAVVGLLQDTSTDFASVVIWHNEDTGANACWFVDSGTPGAALNPASSLFTAVPDYWNAACTNNTLATGDNVYFYSEDTGNSAVWNMDCDSNAGTIVISDAQYITDGDTATRMVADEDWSIIGSAAAQGGNAGDGSIQIACDLIWSNSSNQRVAMWFCNPAANWQSDGEGYVMFDQNGAAATPTAGNMLVGVGQSPANGGALTTYGTDASGANLQKVYWQTSMVWNNAGLGNIYEMSTLLDPAAFDRDGVNTAGSGLIRNPNHVIASQQY